MVEKYFCDVCGKETDGILEQFDDDGIDFFLVWPEFNDEGTETQASVKITIRDLCKDCHATVYDFLDQTKKNLRVNNIKC